MPRNGVCHTNIDFTHMVVRYDTVDLRLAVTVAYATSLEEAQALWRAFVDLAPTFAPTALYAIRYYAQVGLYQKS
jgi:hypothetical protein